MIVKYEDMQNIYKAKSSQILDARLAIDFAGFVEEPTLCKTLPMSANVFYLFIYLFIYLYQTVPPENHP